MQGNNFRPKSYMELVIKPRLCKLATWSLSNLCPPESSNFRVCDAFCITTNHLSHNNHYLQPKVKSKLQRLAVRKFVVWRRKYFLGTVGLMRSETVVYPGILKVRQSCKNLMKVQMSKPILTPKMEGKKCQIRNIPKQ